MPEKKKKQVIQALPKRESKDLVYATIRYIINQEVTKEELKHTVSAVINSVA